MYLPENDAQMRDILADLRLYAQVNDMPNLAEELDDAILTLACEARRGARKRASSPRAGDGR